ncbi:MAG: hypothetical protein RLZZ499_702, partial [Cyanobacteriota bacterium]
LAKLESSGNTPEFIRTHPSSENRIKAISQNTQISNSNKGQDPTEYSNNVLSLL